MSEYILIMNFATLHVGCKGIKELMLVKYPLCSSTLKLLDTLYFLV